MKVSTLDNLMGGYLRSLLSLYWSLCNTVYWQWSNLEPIQDE
jgi:hypothetical protein